MYKCFVEEEAKAYGLKNAIVLTVLRDNLETASVKCLINKCDWSVMSIEGLVAEFPFLEESEIRSILDDLVAKKLLVMTKITTDATDIFLYSVMGTPQNLLDDGKDEH